MPHLQPKERVAHFKEVELGLSKGEAKKEARRCLRCDLEKTLKQEKAEEKELLNIVP
jgi:NADPH-dependent glutamate synthase beta subunit-like oxidoreductase